MITTANQACEIARIFKGIKARGGHAAIDYYAGELVLMCTRPDADNDKTWGNGAIPQTFGDDWVRIVSTEDASRDRIVNRQARRSGALSPDHPSLNPQAMASAINAYEDEHPSTNGTTSATRARGIRGIFELILANGGHAAIDYWNGWLRLECSQPKTINYNNWGRGVITLPSQDVVRLVSL